jgi:hypothetical protein
VRQLPIRCPSRVYSSLFRVLYLYAIIVVPVFHLHHIEEMSGSGGSLPVRYHCQLSDNSVGGFTQHTIQLSCHPTNTFGEIKTRIWEKLGSIVPGSSAANVAPPDEYVFQLATGEVTFEDDDVFSRFISSNEVFRENTPSSQGAAAASALSKDPTTQPMLECVVFHRDHVADRYTREMRMPSICGLLQHRGGLSVRVDGLVGASWKRRYAAVHDMVFFLFDTEEAYNKRDLSSVDFLLLGPVVAVRLEPTTSDRGHQFLFEIKKATAPVSQGGPLAQNSSIPPPTTASTATSKPLIFYTETEQALHQWISTINRLYLRRVKLVCTSIVEELESRGLESSEGLFRLSANKQHVELLQAEFDKGKAPNLGLIADEHVLTNCLKNSLRNMQEPLLPFDAYPFLIKVTTNYPLSATDPSALKNRLEGLKNILDRLPQSNAGLLEYLMSFLSRVAEYSATNRMSASNLAIVFSPNILRPRVENVASIMADSKHVLDCIEAMITHAADIWPNYTNTRRVSRLAFFTGSRPASGPSTPTSANGPTSAPGPRPAPHSNLASVAEAPTPQRSNQPAARSGPFPPPGPPPVNGDAAPAATSVASPTSTATATTAGGASLPVGAVKLPFIPIGGVQLMPRGGKFGLKTTEAAASSIQQQQQPSSSASATTTFTPAAGASVPPKGRAGALPGPPSGTPPASAAGPVSGTLKRQLEVSAPAPVPDHAPLPRGWETEVISRAPRPSVAGPTVLAALPEEMLALQEDSNALNERWIASIKVGGRGMADALTSLLDAHALAMKRGTLTSEASASTALTVQRCVNLLAADMARIQSEYTNLVKFVEEQSKHVPNTSELASGAAKLLPGRPHRTSSACKPQRQAATAPAAINITPVHGIASTGAKPPPLPPLPTALPVVAATPPAIPALPASIVSPTNTVAAAAATGGTVAPSAVAPTPPPPPPAPRAEPGDMVEASFAYDGGNDSLSLKVGERLLLIEGDEQDTEWWLGRKEGTNIEGYFPASFVTLA